MSNNAVLLQIGQLLAAEVGAVAGLAAPAMTTLAAPVVAAQAAPAVTAPVAAVSAVACRAMRLERTAVRVTRTRARSCAA